MYSVNVRDGGGAILISMVPVTGVISVVTASAAVMSSNDFPFAHTIYTQHVIVIELSNMAYTIVHVEPAVVVSWCPRKNAGDADRLIPGRRMGAIRTATHSKTQPSS